MVTVLLTMLGMGHNVELFDIKQVWFRNTNLIYLLDD